MKRNPTKIIFVIYCAVLAWIIMLKMSVSLEDLRFLVRNRVINLVPLDYGVPIGIPQIREATLNTLLFLPMGIYMRMLDISWKNTVFYGFCISLSFEICQYLLAIGVTDITDLLTNTLGSAVGVGLYWLLRKLLRDKQKADRVTNTAAALVLLVFGALVLLMIIAN